MLLVSTLAEFLPQRSLIVQGKKMMMIILSSGLLMKNLVGIF